MTASVYLTLRGRMTAKHPSVGVLCCEDGSVMLPCSGTHKPRWTLGSNTGSLGYKRVRIGHIPFSVHRLIAEAFLSNFNNYPTVDHINRKPSDNRLCNLRWADYKMQSDNTRLVASSVNKYGCRDCDDRKSYKDSYYKTNKEEILSKQRIYYREHKDVKREYRRANSAKLQAYSMSYYAKRLADGYVRKRVNGKRVWVLNKDF